MAGKQAQDGLLNSSAGSNCIRVEDIQPLLIACRRSLSPYSVHVSLKHASQTGWIDSFCKELALYAPYFTRRNLASLWIQDMPSKLVTSADFTEITYSLSSRLKPTLLRETLFGVELSPRHICEDKLSLYKGLGVNSLLLSMVSGQDRDALTPELAGRITQIGFNSLLCKIPLDVLHEADASKWLDAFASLGTSVLVASNDKLLSDMSRISSSLSAAGYEPFGVSETLLSSQFPAFCLTARLKQPNRDASRIASVISNPDWLGLGCSATGYLSGHFYQNQSVDHAYTNAVDNHQLPITHI